MCKENIIPTTVLELFIIHQMKCHSPKMPCISHAKYAYALSHTSSKRLQYSKASRYIVFGLKKKPSIPKNIYFFLLYRR